MIATASLCQLQKGVSRERSHKDKCVNVLGEPANFLDVGGSVQEDQVKEAFRIISGDSRYGAFSPKSLSSMFCPS